MGRAQTTGCDPAHAAAKRTKPSSDSTIEFFQAHDAFARWRASLRMGGSKQDTQCTRGRCIWQRLWQSSSDMWSRATTFGSLFLLVACSAESQGDLFDDSASSDSVSNSSSNGKNTSNGSTETSSSSGGMGGTHGSSNTGNG